MPLATPDKILPTAGTRLEVGTSVEHKVLERGRQLQATNKDNWRSRLIEQPRNLEDLKGQAERVENDFSINHVPYKDGTPEKNDADARSTGLKKIDTALTDLQRGFNNLDTHKRDAVLDSLTPVFTRTARWQEIVNNTPAGKTPPSEAEAKLFLSEMLTKGEIDPVSLHKEFKEAITSSQQDLKVTYAQIELKNQEFQQLQKTDQKLEQQQQEIERHTKKIQEELDKFDSGKEYDTILKNYENNRGPIDEAIENLPGEIDVLNDDIRDLERKLEAEEKKSGYVGIGKVIAAATAPLMGNMGEAATGATTTAETALASLGEKLENKIIDKKRDRQKKYDERKEVNRKKSQYEDKKALKKEKEEDKKKQEEDYNSIAEKRRTLGEQAKLIQSEIARSVESFADLEERVIDRMNGVAENALINANNAIMEREAINLESGLAAISHEHRTMVRNFVTAECSTKARKIWIIRVDAEYNKDNIDGLWNKILNETNANHDARNANSTDKFLKDAISTSEINWANCTPEEKQQMRALLTEEGIRIRFEATGKAPTALEQRILMTQSWNEELIKAGVLKNPDFAQKLQDGTGVTAANIAKGDPEIMDKATEFIGKDRIIFLIMIGLTATQAVSQVQKEGPQQQA